MSLRIVAAGHTRHYDKMILLTGYEDLPKMEVEELPYNLPDEFRTLYPRQSLLREFPDIFEELNELWSQLNVRYLGAEWVDEVSHHHTFRKLLEVIERGCSLTSLRMGDGEDLPAMIMVDWELDWLLRRLDIYAVRERIFWKNRNQDVSA